MADQLAVRLLGPMSDPLRRFTEEALDIVPASVGDAAHADAAVVAVDLDRVVTPLVDLSSAHWADAVDRPLRQLLAALQDARAALLPSGGAIVVIVPTIGGAGAKGLVALTTVVEGARAMAKSAARQWGAEGIAVNAIALPLALLAPELAGCTTHLPPASGAMPSPPDVGLLLHALLRTSTAVTGATIVADGGSVMVP